MTEFQTHFKAREKHPHYPDRFPVDDDHVSWSVSFPDYKPVDFTSPIVQKNQSDVKEGGWADPEDIPVAELEARLTYCGEMTIENAKPRNPIGRTGIAGRGLLGKFGPNHAADPIVTRCNPISGLLEMVAVQRKDTHEWACPGGMVDAGEVFSTTLKREFGEEAMGNYDLSEDERADIKRQLDELFSNQWTELYRGYVDDPRNTDCSWMETVVVHIHCPDSLGRALKLEAGDDAAKVRWLRVEKNEEEVQKLYASHRHFVDLAINNYYSSPSEGGPPDSSRGNHESRRSRRANRPSLAGIGRIVRAFSMSSTPRSEHKSRKMFSSKKSNSPS